MSDTSKLSSLATKMRVINRDLFRKRPESCRNQCLSATGSACMSDVKSALDHVMLLKLEMAGNSLRCFANKLNFLLVGYHAERCVYSALTACQTRGYAKKVGKCRISYDS